MFARLTDAHDERMAALGLAAWARRVAPMRRREVAAGLSAQRLPKPTRRCSTPLNST